MTYNESLEWLYNSMPVFHREGANAYKPGLERVEALLLLFGNPHRSLKCIHVAGTNGKGSVSSMLASILTRAGFKTGLFTSPHILDFRERIRVNGHKIPESEVCRFVERFRDMSSSVLPSFFELTTAMAFDYFQNQNVDIAVIETGLGGRLDSTNVITPLLSVITNISLDHTQFLGDTLEKIAGEKAGIIKPNAPVIIGETHDDTKRLFLSKAKECNSEIVFADEKRYACFSSSALDGLHFSSGFGELVLPLFGEFQKKNINTVLASVGLLRKYGVVLSDNAVIEGLKNVSENSGLYGRFTKLNDKPLVIYDTGHNSGGWREIVESLNSIGKKKILIVGFVNDKDVDSVMELCRNLKSARFVFTRPSSPRGLDENELASIARKHGLDGPVYADVNSAYSDIMQSVSSEDMVFVGGSNFLIADFLSVSVQR